MQIISLPGSDQQSMGTEGKGQKVRIISLVGSDKKSKGTEREGQEGMNNISSRLGSEDYQF